MFHVKDTLYRKCETYIPRNETAQPKRQRKGKTDIFFSGFLRTVEMMMQTFGQNAPQLLTSVVTFFDSVSVLRTESIERFIEEQVFSSSYAWAPPSHPYPVFLL